MNLKNITDAIRDNGFSWDSAYAIEGPEDSEACVKVDGKGKYFCKGSSLDVARQELYNKLVEAKIINPQTHKSTIANSPFYEIKHSIKGNIIYIEQERNANTVATLDLTKQCAQELGMQLIKYAGWQPMSTAPRDGREILVKIKPEIQFDSPIMEVRYTYSLTPPGWTSTTCSIINPSENNIIGWLPSIK